MQKTLSVVIPNRNHGRYLPMVLQAIPEPHQRDVQIIIVDDASTDDSLAIIDSLAKKDSRIEVYRNSAQVGTVESLIRGTSKATGDYLFCPGADDIFMPGMAFRSLMWLERHLEAGLCASPVGCMVDGKEMTYKVPVIQPVSWRGHPPVLCYFSPQECLEHFKRYGSWLVTQSIVFDRKKFLAAGGHRPELGHSHDGYLIYTLALKYGVCYIPEVMSWWRRDLNSAGLNRGQDAYADWKESKDVMQAMEAQGVPLEFMPLYGRFSNHSIMAATVAQYPQRLDQISFLMDHRPQRTLVEWIIYFAFDMASLLPLFFARLFVWWNS